MLFGFVYRFILQTALDKVGGFLSKIKEALRWFARPSLLLICLGGAIRNGGGIAIAYNFVLFYQEYHPEVKVSPNTMDGFSL